METAPPPIKRFSDLAIPPIEDKTQLEGAKIEINTLFGREIIVHSYTVHKSKYPLKEHPGVFPDCLYMQISLNGSKRVLFSISSYLHEQLKRATLQNGFPFSAKIVKKDNNSHQFE